MVTCVSAHQGTSKITKREKLHKKIQRRGSEVDLGVNATMLGRWRK